MNHFILKSLRNMLGLEKERIHTKEFNDINFIFGALSDGEFDLFEKTQEDFQNIDSEMWK